LSNMVAGIAGGSVLRSGRAFNGRRT
jgi:hypothetical protein